MNLDKTFLIKMVEYLYFSKGFSQLNRYYLSFKNKKTCFKDFNSFNFCKIRLFKLSQFFNVFDLFININNITNTSQFTIIKANSIKTTNKKKLII